MAFMGVSCSSSDEGPRDMPPPNITWIYYQGDFIKDITDKPGTMYYDYKHDKWYIEDAEMNRYYIFCTNWNYQDAYYVALSEKATVTFEGKVYAITNEWLEYKGMSSMLDTIGLYALITPDFSINLIEYAKP